MLEAGGWYDGAKQSDMFKWPYNAPHRAAGTKEKPFGYFDATLLGGWHVPGEPYTNASGTDWMWWRARMLGGRTNHYGRISLRMGPVRFQALQPRWPGLRLAHHLRRTRALLRQSRRTDRRLRQPGGPREYARRQVSSRARAARLRAAGEAGLRQGEHSVHPVAAGDSDALHPWAGRVPLLRAMRARLRRQRQLQFSRRAHLPGDEDRQPGGAHRRHGARSSGGSRWPGARRLLHRQEDAQRSHGQCQGRGAWRRVAAKPRASC